MEGPSVHMVADELRPFIGQTIADVGGNADQPLKLLAGEEITDVRAVKKRLFIETPAATAVTHFLMYGSYRVNERRDLDERLRLTCTDDELTIYSASVKVFQPGDEELEDYDDPAADVLSPRFDRERANRELDADRPVADILIDQDVFGGVGNIIKNEVLWQECIPPRTPGADLSDDERARLTDAAVRWTRDWYRRKHSGDRADTQIYRASECPRCGTDVTREDVGEYDRVTFWCPACQDRDV